MIGVQHRGIAQFLMLSLMVFAIVCVAMYGVDRPVAIWANAHVSHTMQRWLGESLMACLTQLFYFLLLAGFVIYYALRWYGMQHRGMQCFALVALSVVFAYFAKTNLQYLFGRYVPQYVGTHSLLFVRNPKLYGFHWFQVGCFPSGHMSVFTAMFVSVMLFYPTWRWLIITLLALLGMLLVIFNYHFVSDVIAGAYLGSVISVGLYTMKYR